MRFSKKRRRLHLETISIFSTFQKTFRINQKLIRQEIDTKIEEFDNLS